MQYFNNSELNTWSILTITQKGHNASIKLGIPHQLKKHHHTFNLFSYFCIRK